MELYTQKYIDKDKHTTYDNEKGYCKTPNNECKNDANRDEIQNSTVHRRHQNGAVSFRCLS